MIVRRLAIQNFRGIREATLSFPGHILLVGPNNVGKSTVLEALELLLGPDRLGRTDAIDEHDFYQSRYVAADGGPLPEIRIEGVLTDLSERAQRLFHRHLEWWHRDQCRLLASDELTPEAADEHEPALRVSFRGWYNAEEDEFCTETEFCHPPAAEGEALDAFRRSHKRECGFLYLRSLRTGSRALSLERGSLLDIILKLHDAETGGLWERILEQVRAIGPMLAEDTALSGVLKGIEERVREFIPLPTGGRAGDLHITDLTRQKLRQTIAFFLRTVPNDTSVPFQHSGNGTLNVLVLALLTFIADLKPDSIIFAMEEPEIAVPPYTQRRIVAKLREKATQCFLTSHSPYVAEPFVPDNLLVLRRQADHELVGTRLSVGPELKRKTLLREFRTRFAEGLLSPAVLVVEGATERAAFPAAADVLASEPGGCTHLDILGVTTIEAGGDGGMEKLGKFFRDVGVRTFAFHDAPNDPAIATRIKAAFDVAVENPCKGIEKLLVTEVPAHVLRAFIGEVRDWPDFPKHVADPGAVGDGEFAEYVGRVLKASKGDGYAAQLVRMCTPVELPATMAGVLRTIQAELTA